MSGIETQGTVFEIQTATTPSIVWTPIGGFKDFNGLGGSAAVIDATDLSSTAKEKLMGLQDWGQFQINYNHDDADAGQDALTTAKSSRELTNFRLTLSDGTIYTFSGFVTSKSISGGVDAIVAGSATIEISGDVTVA